MKVKVMLTAVALIMLSGCSLTNSSIEKTDNNKAMSHAEATYDVDKASQSSEEFKPPIPIAKRIMDIKVMIAKERIAAIAKSEAQNKRETQKETKTTDNTTSKKNSSEKTHSPAHIIDAPLIAQLPELPRGCEVTSLTMLLKYAGVKNIDKMTLAKEIKRDPTPYSIKDGKIHFGNPNTGFVGDMYSFKTHGFGVFHGPITELAKKYLGNRVIDLTGKGFEAIEKQIDQKLPVWVVNTSWFSAVPERYWKTWVTPKGEIKITMKEHSVLVTGYDKDFIYFNDPLAVQKNRKVARSSFVAGWKQYGQQAVSYK